MAEPALKLSFKLSGNDFKGFFKQADKNARSGLYVILAVLLLVATLALYLFVADFLDQLKVDELTGMIVLVVLIGSLLSLYLFLSRRLRRSLQARKLGRHNGSMRPISFEIGAEGITMEDGLSKSWYHWKAIERVDITKDSVVMTLDPSRAVIIPRRVLGDQDKVKDFKRHIDAFVSAAQRG